MDVFGVRLFTPFRKWNMNGFADSRDYYAAVFSADIPGGLEGVWRAIPNAHTGRPLASRPEFEVQHGYVSSRERFAAPERLVRDESASTDDTPVYRYDIYLMRCTTSVSEMYVIAFPFRRLGRHLMSEILDNRETHKFSFCSVDLKKLVSAIGLDRHKGGDIRIVGYDMQVTSDPKVTEVMLRGEDPIHSPLFRLLEETLPPKALVPRTCVLVHDDSQVPRIRLHCDRFGNYKFYLKKRAENLVAFSITLDYLEQEGLVRRTTTSPFRRTLLEDDDGEETLR